MLPVGRYRTFILYVALHARARRRNSTLHAFALVTYRPAHTHSFTHTHTRSRCPHIYTRATRTPFAPHAAQTLRRSAGICRWLVCGSLLRAHYPIWHYPAKTLIAARPLPGSPRAHHPFAHTTHLGPRFFSPAPPLHNRQSFLPHSLSVPCAAVLLQPGPVHGLDRSGRVVGSMDSCAPHACAPRTTTTFPYHCRYLYLAMPTQAFTIWRYPTCLLDPHAPRPPVTRAATHLCCSWDDSFCVLVVVCNSLTKFSGRPSDVVSLPLGFSCGSRTRTVCPRAIRVGVAYFHDACMHATPRAPRPHPASLPLYRPD